MLFVASDFTATPIPQLRGVRTLLFFIRVKRKSEQKESSWGLAHMSESPKEDCFFTFLFSTVIKHTGSGARLSEFES